MQIPFPHLLICHHPCPFGFPHLADRLRAVPADRPEPQAPRPEHGAADGPPPRGARLDGPGRRGELTQLGRGTQVSVDGGQNGGGSPGEGSRQQALSSGGDAGLGLLSS